MPSLKKLSTRQVALALATVSAALLVLALALVPAPGATVPALLIWLVAALTLLGAWAMLLIEVLRRYFGGGKEEPTARRQHQR